MSAAPEPVPVHAPTHADGEQRARDTRRGPLAALSRAPGARWAARLLLVAGALFLAAPLLPLPSPVAMRALDEPLAPVPPWERFAEHGFQREYWRLSALDEALVDARVALFGDWQTAPWLGTDARGRDLLARVVWGGRTSLSVALVAAVAALLLGLGVGASAGLAGGRVDELLMRLVDVLQSVPFLFVVIYLVTLLGESRDGLERTGLPREALFYLAVGAVSWLSMARVVRGQVLALRESDFVAAARLAGASSARILRVHVVPNVLPVVAVTLTLSVPSIVLYEAFLSFLGLGIEPPKVSWGLLCASGIEALNPIRVDWWLVLFPSLAMASVLLALNLVGDGLRDALDVRAARDESRGAA